MCHRVVVVCGGFFLMDRYLRVWRGGGGLGLGVYLSFVFILLQNKCKSNAIELARYC